MRATPQIEEYPLNLNEIPADFAIHPNNIASLLLGTRSLSCLRQSPLSSFLSFLVIIILDDEFEMPSPVELELGLDGSLTFEPITFDDSTAF